MLSGGGLQVEAEVTYGRHLARQAKDAASLRRDEAVALDPSERTATARAANVDSPPTRWP